MSLPFGDPADVPAQYGNYVNLSAGETPMWWFDGAAAPGWLDWVALALTVSGFAVAYLQLRKTKTAAERATAALGTAQAQLSERALHAVAPQFHHALEDLHAAMKSGEEAAAQRALVRFARLADEAADVLDRSFPEHSVLTTELSTARIKATRAKVLIATKPSTDVSATLRPIYKEADAVMMSIDKITTHLRNRVEGSADV